MKTVYVLLKNDSSKRIVDMEIIAMSYDFRDLQYFNGTVLTVMYEN